MNRNEMIDAIRSAVDYVRANVRELGPKIWDKDEREKVKELISDIREYINNKYANPPMSHVYNKVVGRNPIDVMFRKAVLEGNGYALRVYPDKIIQDLRSARRKWKPPKEKPPDTFYLHEMHPSKTDQNGVTFRKSKTKAAKRVRRRKREIREKTEYQSGHEKPERDEEALAEKNKQFWDRVLNR